MKNFILTFISLAILGFAIHPAYADDSALPKLKMKIINTIKGQNFALCLSENCYALTTPDQDIALEGATIDTIIMANMNNMQMYAQSVPDSCKVTVKENQTLIVTGKLVAKNSAVYLNNLDCSVTANA
jgi:hypothetical protein